ncbi:hypothetical protein D9V30_10205 [Mycetocola reblochoni]|uniref:Uncharacterized protein n=1 Tax=Mycetocola reblochoni TaxID=331618 RepID=A0A3L6ZMW6_9MICO|nr:hypothetical protein [Mycetocola reblochoni]RLP68352.1 hypothetical protein D9V30_10205 [Mycetocola reblochoni]
MSITAFERGRSLVFTIGDQAEPDHVTITVPPLPVRDGALLLAEYVGVVFGEADSIEELGRNAESMARRAVGPTAWEALQELRAEESNTVINAAVMWNVQGGGMQLVRDIIAGDPRVTVPKAREALLNEHGLSQASAALGTLLSGALESLTPSQDGTPDTTIPTGTSTPSEG